MEPTELPPIVHTQITEHPIASEDLVEAARRTDAGAVVVFEGTVRSPNKGYEVLCLEYEAYVEVAARQLRIIVNDAIATHGLLSVAAVHRIGRVEVGDPAVLVVVTSRHRGAAFDGCEEIIDRVKGEAAIWKKEVRTDGSYWVDDHG